MEAHTKGPQDQLKATAQLALGTLAWVATLALARFGPVHLWDAQAASWAAVVANVVGGIVWIFAFIRYLRGLDELQRKITQDALAVALGVGWVAGFAYVVADNANILTNDINVAVLPTLMGVVYMIATFAGMIRYR